MMNTEWLFVGGIAALWGQVKGILDRLRAVAMIRATISGNAALAVRAYAQRHWWAAPASDRYIRSTQSYVRPLKGMADVAFEVSAKQPMIFFARCWPVWLGALQHQQGVYPEYDSIVVSALRGTIDLERLIAESLREFHGQSTGGQRYQLRRVFGRGSGRGGEGVSPNGRAYNGPTDSDALMLQHAAKVIGWQRNEVGPDRPRSPLASLTLGNTLQEALEEFRHWLESREWFQRRQVPWRRGWLLHGRPGTGKTSFVRALAQEFDLPVWSFDLSTLSNEELIENWQEMQAQAPCIALIEDIDGVFHGRENVLRSAVGGGSTLTFDCVLNCLSGIQTADGVFTVVTTNRLELVDDALGRSTASGDASRPGRLDRVIEVPMMQQREAYALVKRILADWPAVADEMLDSLPPDLTAAQLTERCVARALDLFWRAQAAR